MPILAELHKRRQHWIAIPDAANLKPTLGIKSVRMLFMLIRFPSSLATRLESCLRKIRVR